MLKKILGFVIVMALMAVLATFGKDQIYKTNDEDKKEKDE